jgi:hypothetical protein
MRKAFVHDAVLQLDSDADDGAPGAAITVALCGSWQHEGPCPLAPHHTSAVRDSSDLVLRVIFATEPESEPRVRSLIVDALATGQLVGPDGEPTSWRLLRQSVGQLADRESSHAARLVADG